MLLHLQRYFDTPQLHDTVSDRLHSISSPTNKRHIECLTEVSNQFLPTLMTRQCTSFTCGKQHLPILEIIY